MLRLAGRAVVSVQNPVVVDDYSEPQPDLVLLRRRTIPYKEAHGTPEDVLLLIEAAETSIRYDCTTKLRLCAEAGVPEYWIVDCVTESVEVYRSPSPDGYQDVSRVTGAASVGPQALSDVVVPLWEIFA